MSDAIEIPAGDGTTTLEGRRHHGATPTAIVAPPHPEYGGSIDNPVVGALMGGLRSDGRGAVCFNWRGVGRSGGAITGNVDTGVEDYVSVIAHALGLTDAGCGSAVVASGYSFGAAVAMGAAVAGAAVDRLLLVAPPVSMLEVFALERVSQPVHVIAGDNDVYAPAEALRGAVGRLSRGTLTLLPGVDHFFMREGLGEVHAAAAAL